MHYTINVIYYVVIFIDFIVQQKIVEWQCSGVPAQPYYFSIG